MGIAPERMDGIVLADALVAPAASDAAAQQEINSKLMPMVTALKGLSDADLAAFARQKDAA